MNAFNKLSCLWQEKMTSIKKQDLHYFNDKFKMKKSLTSF